jgi:hypothetical protein
VEKNLGDLLGRDAVPSIITVQTPQAPCSQPRWVPVSPRSSRRKSSGVRRFSKIIAENIPGAEYREVKNGGHIPFVEKPRETSALVIEFLGEQAGSRSAA